MEFKLGLGLKLRVLLKLEIEIELELELELRFEPYKNIVKIANKSVPKYEFTIIFFITRIIIIFFVFLLFSYDWHDG